MKPLLFCAAMLVASPGAAATFAEQFPDDPGFQDQELQARLDSFDYQSGEIALPGGQITLSVPDNYYYLDAEDASRVLIEIWGNPFGTELGMIFPNTGTPVDLHVWGVDLSWDAIGYVVDDASETLDTEAMLSHLTEATATESAERVQLGAEPVTMVGWAVTPTYDPQLRALQWGEELEFGGVEQHTLNYRMRLLGRQGVLVANLIADMSQLEEISIAASEVAQMPRFTPGNRYDDFDPAVDPVAAVDLNGLVTGTPNVDTAPEAEAEVEPVAAAAPVADAGGSATPTNSALVTPLWLLLLIPLIWLAWLFARRAK